MANNLLQILNGLRFQKYRFDLLGVQFTVSVMSYLGTTLKILMKEFDINGRELAKRTGLQGSKISRLVRGDQPRDKKDIDKLCRVFSNNTKTGDRYGSARIIEAWCNDHKVGLGSELVHISIYRSDRAINCAVLPETEKAFERIRAAIHEHPERQALLVEIAKVI